MKRLLGVALLLVAAVASTAAMGAILFLGAGKWDLPTFWAWLALTGALSVVGWLAIDPGLIRERLKPGPGGHDSIVIYAGKLLVLAHLIIAGLDVGRFHWSVSSSTVVQIVSLAGYGLGFALAMWSMSVNRFFSTVIRLQEDRGHHVITAGPYAYVRHPGYTGICLGILFSGPALGSWLSVVPAVLFALLIVRRTRLEDRFLHDHLQGYEQYAARVRYRLAPGLW